MPTSAETIWRDSPLTQSSNDSRVLGDGLVMGGTGWFGTKGAPIPLSGGGWTTGFKPGGCWMPCGGTNATGWPVGSAGKTATTSVCIPTCVGRASSSAFSPNRSKDIPGEFTNVSPGDAAGAGIGGGSNAWIWVVTVWLDLGVLGSGTSTGLCNPSLCLSATWWRCSWWILFRSSRCLAWCCSLSKASLRTESNSRWRRIISSSLPRNASSWDLNRASLDSISPMICDMFSFNHWLALASNWFWVAWTSATASLRKPSTVWLACLATSSLSTPAERASSCACRT